MEAAMLRRLRAKFIALNMATVAVVLAILFTAICYIDYQQGVSSVHAALDASIDRAAGTGTQPPAPTGTDATADAGAAGDVDAGDSAGAGAGAADGTGEPAAPGDADGAGNSADDAGGAAEGAAATAPEPAGMAPPEIGGKRAKNDPVIPVVVCAVEADGSRSIAPSATTASIAAAVLDSAVAAVADESEGTGYLDALGLFYAKRTVGGTTLLAFADASAAASWQSLALALAAIGAGALVVFVVVSVFFSRWALRPVQRAWSQQQRFVADASHELKTPLTVILANTAILREHPERSIASQSQWIESTQTEAERMQELVCDMLDLAKPDHAPSRQHEPVDLTDLVEGVLLQFESVAFERHVALSAKIDRAVNVTGDATRLRRLTATLLDNACKYTNEGGSIAVTLRQTVRRIELSVHNTGTAIAREDLPHVFDRFYRADKARTRATGSYGLGLAIVREIAKEHGGAIEAASEESAGTTFTVTLPLPTA